MYFRTYHPRLHDFDSSNFPYRLLRLNLRFLRDHRQQTVSHLSASTACPQTSNKFSAVTVEIFDQLNLAYFQNDSEEAFLFQLKNHYLAVNGQKSAKTITSQPDWRMVSVVFFSFFHLHSNLSQHLQLELVHLGQKAESSAIRQGVDFVV